MENLKTAGGGSFEVVENFFYLGDMLSSEGGVERSVITRVVIAWRKFRELLFLLTSRVLSLQVRDWKSAINITRPTHASMENGR